MATCHKLRKITVAWITKEHIVYRHILKYFVAGPCLQVSLSRTDLRYMYKQLPLVADTETNLHYRDNSRLFKHKTNKNYISVCVCVCVCVCVLYARMHLDIC